MMILWLFTGIIGLGYLAVAATSFMVSTPVASALVQPLSAMDSLIPATSTPVAIIILGLSLLVIAALMKRVQ